MLLWDKILSFCHYNLKKKKNARYEIQNKIELIELCINIKRHAFNVDRPWNLIFQGYNMYVICSQGI